MQSELDWTNRSDFDEDVGAAERYRYFMRPEPFEDLGPIRLVDDPYLGKGAKVRDMAIGMVRNATDKKSVTAYLLPFPHLRIDKAKELQGWYKALHEPPNVRPRPCFTEAILTEPYGGYCLPEGSLIETPAGLVPIEEILLGDSVMGQLKSEIVPALVIGTLRRVSKTGMVCIHTTDGEKLSLTHEHPVYSISRNCYIPAGEIRVNESIETREAGYMRKLRNRCQAGQEFQHSSFLFGLSIPTGSNGIMCQRKNSSYGQLDLCQSELQPSSAGLPPGRRFVYRSQGVYGQTGSVSNSSSKADGVRHRSLRSETDDSARYSVVANVEILSAPVVVYDIQTSTENFYVRGENGLKSFHVHNCAVGCQFCYINSGVRGYRGTGLITVPMNYGDQIAEQLKKMRRAAAGYFSSFTDPFTPLEQYYHNTENAAREFVKVGLPIFFLSRLPYPSWAIELLQQNPYSYAQKSINTCSAEDWRYLSPGALPLAEHLEEIAALHDAGIYVSIQVNPVVAGVTSHSQIVELFRQLANAGADHVIVKFVEAGYSWAPAMVERMVKRFGDRGKLFEKLFIENIGGQRTIEEKYRLEGHQLYSAAAKKYGLTYATCYEYRYERNKDGSIKNKTGVSIGREYATAEQCHGHRVPMYSRDSADELFQAMEVCPPSGCLYCAAENNGEPRCGDELAGEGKALRLVDLKVPFKHA